jgi:hypothetical protein
VPLVVPDQWGIAAASLALVGYDQWHPNPVVFGEKCPFFNMEETSDVTVT